MRSRDLGVNINQTLVVNGVNSMKDSTYNTVFPAFRQDILRLKDVQRITGSSDVPGTEITWSTDWQRLRSNPKKNYTLRHLGVDYDYINNYGLKLIAGRQFSKDFPTDKKGVILNESAIRELGYAKPEDAIGEPLHGGQSSIDTVHVIGVAADFHQEGLAKAIVPLAILLRLPTPNFYSIRINSENTHNTVDAIKTTWQRNFPGDPFRYFFLDEHFNKQYAENERFGTVFGLFATLAIIIACLGLLGLSAYNVLQRTKEIGIRKVLGASVQNLLFILSRDFLLLVAVAFVIAVPHHLVGHEQLAAGIRLPNKNQLANLRNRRCPRLQYRPHDRRPPGPQSHISQPCQKSAHRVSPTTRATNPPPCGALTHSYKPPPPSSQTSPDPSHEYPVSDHPLPPQYPPTSPARSTPP